MSGTLNSSSKNNSSINGGIFFIVTTCISSSSAFIYPIFSWRKNGEINSIKSLHINCSILAVDKYKLTRNWYTSNLLVIVLILSLGVIL